MKRNTRFSKTFYKKQNLPIPKAEYWPESGKDIVEILQNDTQFVAIGGGQHFDKKRINENSEVLRLGKMNDVLNFDKVSMLAKLEAGMSWGDFKRFAKERSISTFPYRLYPDQATLGGIVSRTTQNRRSLWDGSLMNYCLGMRGLSRLGDYQYLSAPRKSSGPDLRSFWFGAAGRYGFVADLTLGLFPVQEKLVLNTSGDNSLLSLPAILENMEIRSAWTHGEVKDGEATLDIGFSGSKRRLDAIVNEIQKQNFAFQHSFIHGTPCEAFRNQFEEKVWASKSERFVQEDEIRTLKTATIVNSSLYGFSILCPHRSKKPKSKWSKRLNSLTNKTGLQ